LTDEHLRTFVALEIGEEMRARIGSLGAELRARLPGVRWVRPEGIHLTLRFLGATTRAQVERLKPTLALAAAACPPAEVAVARLGAFPERGSPRVLWLGLSLPAPLAALQSACERAAAATGFDREDRPFRAHLTLGRWRDRAPRPDLPTADLGTTHIETLVLFESRPQAGGSVYVALERFPLCGGRSMH
jgi:2'-5' RNA ligase